MTAETPSSNSTAPGRRGRLVGLLILLAAIVLGAVVGIFYGESMWMASGGPERSLDRLGKTLAQKKEFAAAAKRNAALADEAGNVAEAQRERLREEHLRGHVPLVEAEIERVQRMLSEHRERLGQGENPARREGGYVAQVAMAGVAWELIKFCGDLFLQVLKLLVIPLVVTSMVCGITSLGDVRHIGKIGGWTLGYFFVTTLFAVVLGIALVQSIQPGRNADDSLAYVDEKVQAKQDGGVLTALLNVVRGNEGDSGSGMFPSNLFQAAATTNVMALIVFALVFGGALTMIGEKGRVVVDFFTAANEAVMKMVHGVMFFAPLGIFGLVAANIAKNGGGAAFSAELARIGWYALTVLIALLIHFVALSVLLPLFARRHPIAFALQMMRALMTAMSTSSSSATLPVTIECAEENAKVSPRVAGFVLPLGATVNMNGTALYEAVAVIFIAQTLAVPMSLGDLIVISLTATLAAIGAAGIPEAGLFTMAIVLTVVGLPMSGIGSILAIDWFLDRARTTVNIYGDAVGAAIIDRYDRVEGPVASESPRES